jgi:hypothetical protein
MAKKVRFGYVPFLDNPDNSPVRNIYYYDLPGVEQGVVRVSGSKTYINKSFTGSWGSNLQAWSVDQKLPLAMAAGLVPYLHTGNTVDGYFLYNGTSFSKNTDSFTPSPSVLATWGSRIFASDYARILLYESYIDFDHDSPTNSPFSYDNNSADPSQGGSTSVDAGNNGPIQEFGVVQNALNIYKQFGIYRWDGSNMIPLNFHNYVFATSVCHSDMFKIDYFLSYNMIYSNDGQTVQPISFGINTIIEDTMRLQGITNPIGYCFDHYAFFYIGNIQVGTDVIANGMFVYDERYQEWQIWSLGHQLTAFGQYVDSQGVRHLLSGDVNGNTYIWSESFASDAGVSIAYRLRTKYFDNNSPVTNKVPVPQTNVSADPAEEAQISMAKNFSNEYKEIGSASGILSSFNSENGAYPVYKTLSVEIAGTTTTNRPEFYGVAIRLDEESDRPDKSPNTISKQ